MSEARIHAWIVVAMFAMAGLTLVGVALTTAPYGRHLRPGWGRTVSSRAGWTVMEAPACLVFAAVFLLGRHRAELAPLVLHGIWQVHYLHRAFLFPLRMRGGQRRLPHGLVLCGLAFNVLNAYVQARWISHLGHYPAGWLADPRFAFGAAVFLSGFAVNVHADSVLLRLRGPGEDGYAIPRGGLYRWISCPNYLGEIVEWLGWGLLTWSPGGLAFAAYTAANLVPRALVHHRWYRERFPEYPARRKAIVPFLV